MEKLEMVVFDMAGTTVCDNREVENCFIQTADRTGLIVNSDRINAMMGWSKRFVFESLWKEQMPDANEHEIIERVNHSYILFKEILEGHYSSHPVIPTVGCQEVMEFLRGKNVKIALTTGFYREVTDIILKRLNWRKSISGEKQYHPTYDVSVSSDQVVAGRPSPFMIFKAMELCRVYDVRKVIKIGDTPSDLFEGKNAGCKFSFGITNGTHTIEELKKYENDGLFADLIQFKQFLSDMLN